MIATHKVTYMANWYIHLFKIDYVLYGQNHTGNHKNFIQKCVLWLTVGLVWI